MKRASEEGVAKKGKRTRCERCGRSKASKRDVAASYDTLLKGRCYDGIDWDNWLRPNHRDGVSVSAKTVQELLGEVALLRALLRQTDCRRGTAERVLLGIVKGIAPKSDEVML